MDRELLLVEPLLGLLVEPLLGLLVVALVGAVVVVVVLPFDGAVDLVRLLAPVGFLPFVVAGLAVLDVVEDGDAAGWAPVIWMFR